MERKEFIDIQRTLDENEALTKGMKVEEKVMED